MADVLPFPTCSTLRVVRADPLNPPCPPVGAHAVEIRDEHDNVLTYAWVTPRVDRDVMLEHSWSWSEALRQALRVTPPSARRQSGDA